MSRFGILIVAGLIMGFSEAVAQINMQDSSLQAVGYWSKGDAQTYQVTQEKYKINNGDTTTSEVVSYVVDVKIVDSTANSYTISWIYRDHRTKNASNILEKVLKATGDIEIIIKTDELGAFQEVVNWTQVRDKVKHAFDLLAKEFKGVAGVQSMLDQMLKNFSTKEGIETASIMDIQQFYTFHGGKYTLHEELSSAVQAPNLFDANAPLDTEVVLTLDELNEAEDNGVIRAWHTFDSKQLTAAAFEVTRKMLEAEGKKITLAEMPPVEMEIRSAARIHGSTGWPIYSVETKETKSADVVAIEERIMEIQFKE